MSDLDRDRNDHLAGAYMALETLCFALIETHHNAHALRAKLFEAKEIRQANLLASASSTQIIEGFDKTIAKIENAVEMKAKRQSTHIIRGAS